MNVDWNSFLSTESWIAIIFVSIVVNIFTHFVNKRVESFLAAYSSRVRRRFERMESEQRILADRLSRNQARLTVYAQLGGLLVGTAFVLLFMGMFALLAAGVGMFGTFPDNYVFVEAMGLTTMLIGLFMLSGGLQRLEIVQMALDLTDERETGAKRGNIDCA